MIAGEASARHAAPLDDGAIASDRAVTVDAARFLMVYLVIILHCLPRENDPAFSSADALLAMACRSAVPYFFIAAGYFLKWQGASLRSLLDRPLSRLLPVYLGWSLVYLFALWALSPDPLGGIDHVVLRGGGGFHLWFLPAIGLSLILVGLGLRTIGWGATAAAAAILFAVGLMLNSYIGEVPEDARRNFLFAPLYVLVGAALRHRRPPLDWRLWATVAGLSFLLLVAEEMVAARLTGSALLSHDSMLATPFLGASLFLLTLSIKANDVIGRVAVVGRMTLGIYAVHVLFIVLLGKPLPTQPWQVAGIALSVLAASTLATLALFRFKPLRPLIS